VVPGGPAARGRKVPLAVVVNEVEGVLHGLARGAEEAGHFEGARLEVFAAAPVLAVNGGAVERPQVAALVVLGEDEDVGDGGVVEIAELALGKVDPRGAR